MNGPTPEQRQQIVNNIVHKAFPEKKVSEDERIISRAMAATRRIRDEFAPMVAAHGYPDKRIHGMNIGRAFLEEFNQWPKDELVYLCAVIHTDTLLERLR
jgi:hypothetical protein